MGPEALLQMACELSYAIARNGVESEPPVVAPPAMRSYLYTADLPSEAYEAARDVVDSDPAFRRRVAEQASQDEVGRAGYLWLHRPIGWNAEFETLSALSEESDDFPDEIEFVPAISEPSNGVTEDFANSDEVRALIAGADAGAARGEIEFDEADETPNEADAFEDELTSLRGLVDRLATERKAVSTSVARVEIQTESTRLQPSMFDSDLYSLQSELEAANTELETARTDREHAVQQHSAALTRQLALEKELDLARERQADIERGHAEADARMVEIQESLARAEASIGPLTAERNALSDQLSELKIKASSLSSELERTSEEWSLAVETAGRNEAGLQAEADSLRIERLALEESLTEARSELEWVSEQLQNSTTQATQAQALVDVLTEEKIEVASRLADTEIMLENTRTQLGAVKSDLAAVTADLAAIKTHRDGLSSQVEELHGSLGEALGNLAKVRAVSDTDRASLKEVRTERDLLKVRLSSLEQVEAGLDAKLESMATERDSLVTKIEESSGELIAANRKVREVSESNASLDGELGQLQMANADLTGGRDRLKSQVEGLRSELAKIESSRDGLAQQVDQLTAENSAIQDQLVESDRLRVETSESQGHALSELAHRLAVVENERSRFEVDLANARKALERAQSSAQPASTAVAASRGVGSLATPNPFAATSSIRDTAESEADEIESVPSALLPTDDIEDASLPVGLDDEGSPGDHDVVTEADAMPGPPVLLELDAVDPGLGTPKPGEEDEDGISTLGRTTKKHAWGLGPLLRTGNRSKKPEDIPDAGAEDLSGDDDFEALAAALAEASKADSDAEAAVNDEDGVDDIRSIGVELVEAGDGAEPASVVEDEDDLDAISDLISQTVTHFDPSDESTESSDSDPSSSAEESESGVDSRMPTNSEIAERDPSEQESETSGRSNGVLTPPSVFSDRDDPFASLDRFEAVTIRPDAGLEADIAASLTMDKTSIVDGDREASDGPIDATAEDDGLATTKDGRSRRRVEIPADLLDDEIELARHVVSSPDVVLLVDGDSVAKMGWPSLPVAQQRDALVSYLADLASSTGAAPDVVFDGRIGEEESLPASRAVRIRLSTPPTEPAAALDELVDAYPEQWPIAVVTDDDKLASSAIERGAVVLNNGQLLDLFIAQ